MKTRLWILASMVLACDAAPNENVPPPAGEQVFDDTYEHANPSSKGTVSIDPSDAEGKLARRISVAQLERSIPALFDGITWTVRAGRNDANAFNALSRTLGEPDYIAVTTENRDPSPLFAKYMDDMAGDVCGKAIERDVAGTAEKLVMVEEDVDANLRFLRLKLHGIWVPDGSTEGLEDLRRLYDDIYGETDDVAQAWFGVCVAMLTAPELMAY
jgi:hypothetical protein